MAEPRHDPGSGTPDPTPNGQTGELICPLATCFGCPDPGRCDALRRGDQPAPSQRDPELAAALNEQRRQSYNAEAQRTRPAPPAAPVDGPTVGTPADERPDTAVLLTIGDWLLRTLPGHQGAEQTAAALAYTARWIDAQPVPVDGPVLDELEQLRGWKRQAIRVLSQWDEVHVALGSPGRLGESKAAASAREAKRLLAAAPSPAPLDVRKLPDPVAAWLADEDGAIIRSIEGALLSVSMERGRGERVSDQAEVVRVLNALRAAAADRGEPTDA